MGVRFYPEKIGLYWYNFKLTAIDKTRYVIPSDPYKVSTIEDYMGRSWQITCYKKGFKTPDWLVGGIMYQIFPTVFISAVKKRILSVLTSNATRIGMLSPNGNLMKTE